MMSAEGSPHLMLNRARVEAIFERFVSDCMEFIAQRQGVGLYFCTLYSFLDVLLHQLVLAAAAILVSPKTISVTFIIQTAHCDSSAAKLGLGHSKRAKCSFNFH